MSSCIEFGCTLLNHLVRLAIQTVELIYVMIPVQKVSSEALEWSNEINKSTNGSNIK